MAVAARPLLLVLAGIAALWYFTREETKNVPDVVGQPLEQAVSRLQDEGFKTDISQTERRRRAGHRLPPGSSGRRRGRGGLETCSIVVSEGPETAQVPAVVGALEEDAREQLEDVGFDVNVVRVFSDEPEGSVVAQAPTGLDEAEVGSTVRINVSMGTGRVEVPNLVGLNEDEARDELEERGPACERRRGALRGAGRHSRRAEPRARDDQAQVDEHRAAERLAWPGDRRARRDRDRASTTE